MATSTADRAADRRGRCRARGVARRRVLAAVVAAVLPGGCGAGASDGDGTTTLTFVNAQDQGTFDQVIAGFERANPGIRIRQEVVPFDDLNSAVQYRLLSEDPGVDLFDVDAPRLAAFAARGFLVDLGELGERARGRVDPEALAGTTYRGRQYALPRWTSTQLLYYNRGLLDKAGVAAPPGDPRSPMTWEDVAAAGRAAQAAGARWGLAFDQIDRYYQLQPLPESLGGGPGLTGPDLLTPQVANPAWVRAFTWYASLFEQGVAPRGVSPEQTGPLFASGNTAFFVGGPWNADAFDQARGLDYDVAPFPVFAGGRPASSTGSWATGVSPFSRHQEAAKEFIAYLALDPTGAWEASSRNIPVQVDAFERYLGTLRGQGGRSARLAEVVAHELASNAVARPRTVGYVTFETAMNKAFADIRNGSDPERRLRAAEAELTRAMAKYRG
ncbi:sugar ABC transporter substrate-binding protein [Saccharothrix coeruleofusca]|uniref:sugar ABC transporter substrate-binding protein n=1 Tax=Saccharothrix coeruleofusca TaxID=33919 RepID=UPI0016707D8E|nr:sugar ABC transporter substrate-binding protein [Saccharothrix coeruleofusca]